MSVRSILSLAISLGLIVLTPSLGRAIPIEPSDPVSTQVDSGTGAIDPLAGDDEDDRALGEYYANRIITGAALFCLTFFCHGAGGLVAADPDLPGAPISEAPEPATATLLAAGLLGVGCARHRRRRAGVDEPRS